MRNGSQGEHLTGENAMDTQVCGEVVLILIAVIAIWAVFGP